MKILYRLLPVILVSLVFGIFISWDGNDKKAGDKNFADPLPSWNEGPSKKAILDFVRSVTTEGGPLYVKTEDRIATFDNDGTLWAEQPMYFQFLFAIDRIKAMAPQHPEWKTKEPYKSILAGNTKVALAGGEKAIAETHNC